MDDGNNGYYRLVFNGQGSPGILSYLATGLTTGLSYRFKVRASNIYGYGSFSNELLVEAVDVPDKVDIPTVTLLTNETSIWV